MVYISTTDYNVLDKEELIQLCYNKDYTINECMNSIQKSSLKILGKKDIMEIYHCESDKALKILKLMFQMGYGNKIGKEYYVTKKSQEDFIDNMRGKEVFI